MHKTIVQCLNLIYYVINLKYQDQLFNLYLNYFITYIMTKIPHHFIVLLLSATSTFTRSVTFNTL